jgi:uncharacterized protein (DUF1697 family)
VALLRGVNVGTAKRIAMKDLRGVVEGLGFRDVVTLLNSGNVVFTAPAGRDATVATRIEGAILKRLGVATRVTVWTGEEVADAIRRNPFGSMADNPSRLLLMAFNDAATPASLRRLLDMSWEPEALALGKNVAYLWCADGIANGRLWTEANRAIGAGGTARNLTTMTKLLALVDAAGPSGPHQE